MDEATIAANIRAKAIAAGVKNLREFGYLRCDEKNILTDRVYKVFFKKMLEENLGANHHKGVKKVLAKLLAEVEGKS